MGALLIARRGVLLAVGSAPGPPRMYRGRDAADWLCDLGHYAITIAEDPDPAAAVAKTNHSATVRDGGHEIDRRALVRKGEQLSGSVADMDGCRFLGLGGPNPWGSGRFLGVGEDAQYVVEMMAGHQADGLRAAGGQTGRFCVRGAICAEMRNPLADSGRGAYTAFNSGASGSKLDAPSKDIDGPCARFFVFAEPRPNDRHDRQIRHGQAPGRDRHPRP